MKNPDDRDQQIEALRNRLSKLSEASLRINESLDLDTVWLGLAILGQEVDHPHRARCPHVQIRQPLAGRAEPIELPRLEIDRLA